MVLDLGRFTRSGLLVDCVRPADTWAGGRSKEKAESARECKKCGGTRQRDHPPVDDGEVIGPSTQLHRERFQ